MNIVTWIDLFKQIRENIEAADDDETLMQVYGNLNALAVEAHLRACELKKEKLKK